ncbi:hypothetical protein [Pseudomonas sp. NPDC087185]|uniref:hypothetical protein n=1 Tax=Pseudomonas sp. NPDC087185 TaxID=3364435 RepID=UPI00381866C4
MNTQGRVYALDLDFGHSTVLKQDSPTLVVFTGAAVKQFVRHHVLYLFGFKLFWGHFVTPDFGDVRFHSVKQPVGNVIEVGGFTALNTTVNTKCRSKVMWARLIYAAVLLAGPSFTLLAYGVGGKGIFDNPAGPLPDLEGVLLSVFVGFFLISMLSWGRESWLFRRFKGDLKQAGLLSPRPVIWRLVNVVWACAATGIWGVFIVIAVFLPWIMLAHGALN